MDMFLSDNTIYKVHQLEGKVCVVNVEDSIVHLINRIRHISWYERI